MSTSLNDNPSRLANFADGPARWALRAGGRLALVDGERRLDWAGFEERISRSAGWLSARGVSRGDRVALLLGNRTVNLEVFFAAARIGALAVPINLLLSPREIAYVLDDCMPSALFHENELAHIVGAACERADHTPAVIVEIGKGSDAWEEEMSRAPLFSKSEPVSPNDPMMIMYTSGTTGVPKGALLPHRKTVYNGINAQLYFGVCSDDRVLVAAPLFHSLGLQILTLPALQAGAAVILHDRFDPERVWRDVEAEGITYLGGVPAMHRRLYEALKIDPSARAAARRLRFIFSAGAAISVELIRAFGEEHVVIRQGYGQTETSTLTCLDDADAQRKAGSVGRPVHHADVRIVKLEDLDGPTQAWRETEPDERGEIVVRGPITMLGYWNKPEATAETLRDGWVRTGDLATRDTEGFISLVGRARDMIISGGENVYPAEVEAVLREHSTVEEVAVVGVPHERWGEVGRAHVVLRRGSAFNEGEVVEWARERLAKFKIPQQWVVEESLPRTASGKVQKHRLVEDA